MYKNIQLEKILNELSNEAISLEKDDVEEIDYSSDYVSMDYVEDVLDNEDSECNTMDSWKEIVIGLLPDNIGLAKQIEIEEIINNIK